MEDKILNEIYKGLKLGNKAALVTLTDVSGSIPGKKGAIMAVWQDGRISGTVGGGKIEHEIIKKAVNCLEKNEDSSFEFMLNEEGNLKMQCGGEVKGFIKTFIPREKLLIAGAGHIGEALFKLAKLLNFYTVVFDDREEFANEERFKEADEIITGDIEKNLLEYDMAGKTYVVIVTRGHEYDTSALRAVISRGASYIGMIGSTKKTEYVLKQLINEGISREDLMGIYAPIGINISSGSPEEIAFAIMAEILLVKNNGSLEHMKDVKKVNI